MTPGEAYIRARPLAEIRECDEWCPVSFGPWTFIPPSMCTHDGRIVWLLLDGAPAIAKQWEIENLGFLSQVPSLKTLRAIAAYLESGVKPGTDGAAL